jgi:RNA polymerase primary sigma factor
MTMNPNYKPETKALGDPGGRKGDSDAIITEDDGPCPPRGPGRRSTPGGAGPKRLQRSWSAGATHSRWPRPLSVGAERELAERIKRGDTTARTQLVLANLSLVVTIVRRYKSRKLSFDDLVQEGNLGLIRASRDFDPSLHGSKFSTYAKVWINCFVYRALVANDSLIRIPEHLFLLRKRYRRAIGALGGPGMTGSDSAATEQPSVEQIAQEMGISPRRLKPSRLAAIEYDPGLEADEDGEIVALTEAMVDCRQPEEDMVNHEERILLEAALRQLNPVEAWVMRERYGLHALIPDVQDWAHPSSRAACQDTGDCTLGTPIDQAVRAPSRSCRTYPDLERDCGLSTHRIRQVERAALDKLRGILSPWLVQDL